VRWRRRVAVVPPREYTAYRWECPCGARSRHNAWSRPEMERLAFRHQVYAGADHHPEVVAYLQGVS
jgi:hypothetical protein